MTRKSQIITLALAAAIAATGLIALAGPINPPAGPVTGTYKTLAEVEPRTAVNATNTPGDATSLFKIIQPGSYYLTGNVAGVSSKSGIVIAADNVSVDLMGFALQGVVGSLDGIATDAAHKNLTVRNGAVSGWGQDGIDLMQGAASTGSLIEGVHASGNARGIVVGFASVIRRCTAARK